MKKLTLIAIVLITLISCNKRKNKFMYKYEYTTEQSDTYSKQNKYDIKITSLSDYKEILTAEQKETERLKLRKSKNTKVLKDTLYFIGTYAELIRN